METLELIEWVVGRQNDAMAAGNWPEASLLNRILSMLIDRYLEEDDHV